MKYKKNTIDKAFGFLQPKVQIPTKVKKSLTISISNIAALKINRHKSKLWINSGSLVDTSKYALHPEEQVLQEIKDEKRM